MKITISDILLAPWITGVITTAIRLNIFSIISDLELTCEEIAAKCEAVPNRLEILLEACVSLGILIFDGHTYRNSHFSWVYFVEEGRFYIGNFLKLLNDESPQWFQLPDIIRGKDHIDNKNPGLSSDYKTFIMAMNSRANLGEAEALKDMVDLTGYKKMIDVGGGSGIYSIALCQKYSELHSTILDVKQALAVTKEVITNQPEKERINLQEGDFMKDSWGDHIDVVLLSDVIYEESKAKIVLKHAWNHLVENGMLIIRGYYADPEKSKPLFGALFAVKELVDNPQEKTMTLSMLEQNVRNTGFEIIKVIPLTEYSSVVVGKKPELNS